jgi:hypothetical protein
MTDIAKVASLDIRQCARPKRRLVVSIMTGLSDHTMVRPIVRADMLFASSSYLT